MNKIKTFLKENWFLILAILYVLFPLDIIPDLAPILGTADDASLLVFELIRRSMNKPKMPINNAEKQLMSQEMGNKEQGDINR